MDKRVCVIALARDIPGRFCSGEYFIALSIKRRNKCPVHFTKMVHQETPGKHGRAVRKEEESGVVIKDLIVKAKVKTTASVLGDPRLIEQG